MAPAADVVILRRTPSFFDGRSRAQRRKERRIGGPWGYAFYRVEKLGWHALRGRRAQNAAPLPTATESWLCFLVRSVLGGLRQVCQ